MPDPTAIPTAELTADATIDTKYGAPPTSIPCRPGSKIEIKNPNTVPPTVAKSGKVIVSISTNAQKTISEAKNIPTNAGTIGSKHHIPQKTNAVRASTSG
jgi:hypothetical protein